MKAKLAHLPLELFLSWLTKGELTPENSSFHHLIFRGIVFSTGALAHSNQLSLLPLISWATFKKKKKSSLQALLLTITIILIIEKLFIYKVHPSKLYNSLICSILVWLYNYHHYLIPDHLYLPIKRPHTPLADMPNCPSFKPSETTNPLFCLYGFPYSGHFM